ncbi:hypothetical protein BH11PLA2_BH11PLA2_08330 [soil metagenome]
MRLIVLFALLIAPPLFAAPPTPRETVLRLVPDNTAVCFVVQNLRDRATIVAASPFAKWASEKLNTKVNGADEIQALTLLLGGFEREIGLTAQQLRDDILGDILVHAYIPAANGDKDQSVFLLHARDAGRLKTLVTKLNEIQKSSTQLKSHRGLDYTQRIKADGTNEYYRQQDNLFVFASSEEALKAVIDREVDKKLDSPVIKALADRGAANAFLACVIQPRPFDTQINAVDTASTDAEKAGKAQVAKLWTSLDQCVIYLNADAELELGVALAYRPDALPGELKTMLSAAPIPSALWQSMPADKLLGIAMQAESTVLLNAVASFLPVAERPKLREKINELFGPIISDEKVPTMLAGVGPDVAIWAAPVKDSWFPSIVSAVRVREVPDADVAGDVVRICEFYLQGVRVEHNKTSKLHIAYKQEKVGNIEIRRLVNDKLFPPGVSPGFAVHDGYLITASTPAAITGFQAPKNKETARSESPVMVVSAKLIHAHLTQHRGDIVTWLAAKQGRTAEAIGPEIDTLMSVLEAFEQIEVVLRGDDHSRTIAIKIKTIKLLKPEPK